ncbi:MAG: bifunctional precorrin-2 dehydrogenase/sirohydrochlorin ferrochelatase [Chloroflexi bacterium]|nr:bifunctional precorrin-2 dehydrogenase/sirohydrochlorin ferrochelatase [Chloroflexota bacterium]
MSAYYPVFLDLRGRECLVIGAGEVATRKVQFLLECGARVTVISPQASREMEELARQRKVVLLRRPYQRGDLKDAFLAIAATEDNQVNRQVAEEAKTTRTLLNVVDVPHLCTFIAPAITQRGEVTVAISTGGASPALARRMREALAQAPAMEWADLASVLAAARQELRRQRVTIPADHWQTCMDQGLLSLVQSGREKEALERLLACLRDGAEQQVRS